MQFLMVAEILTAFKRLAAGPALVLLLLGVRGLVLLDRVLIVECLAAAVALERALSRMRKLLVPFEVGPLGEAASAGFAQERLHLKVDALVVLQTAVGEEFLVADIASVAAVARDDGQVFVTYVAVKLLSVIKC